MSPSKNKITIVYDKQCPVCENFTKLIRLKESGNELILVNAREDSEIMNKLTRYGFDIDQGMVVKLNAEYYYGAEAMHVLAMISGEFILFNRLLLWAFRSKYRADFFYPICRGIRNLLLKVLGKTKINNLKKENNTSF